MQDDNSHTQQFNEIFSEYHSRFIHFAFGYLCDKHVAEDIVMESYMYYWENRLSLAADSNIPAYILSMIKHKSLNYLRSKNVHRKAENLIQTHNDRVLKANLASLEACDPQELFSEEVHTIVNQVLHSLSKNTKEIFILSRYRRKSYKEIASELNISERSVEFHISKALKELRKALRDYHPILIILLLNQWH